MFFRKNRESIGCVDIYAPVVINSDTKEVIDFVANHLNQEQLKKFEVKNNDGMIDFKERMELNYGRMYPVDSLEKLKNNLTEFIETILEKYSESFGISTISGWDRHFIKEFSILFEEKKGKHAKLLKEVSQALKKSEKKKNKKPFY